MAKSRGKIKAKSHFRKGGFGGGGRHLLPGTTFSAAADRVAEALGMPSPRDMPSSLDGPSPRVDGQPTTGEVMYRDADLSQPMFKILATPWKDMSQEELETTIGSMALYFRHDPAMLKHIAAAQKYEIVRRHALRHGDTPESQPDSQAESRG